MIRKLMSQPNMLPSGFLPGDHNIEFVGKRDTKTVLFLQNGETHLFSELSDGIYKKLKALYLKDKTANDVLSVFYPEHQNDTKRLVELYTYYMYGCLDSVPDVKNGKLQPSENFRDNSQCISQLFSEKHITVADVELNDRDLIILDAMADGLPDKTIADSIGISQSTLDFHKRNLFKRLSVHSKTEAVVKAYKNNVLCNKS